MAAVSAPPPPSAAPPGPAAAPSAPDWVVAAVVGQLRGLHAAATAPFVQPFADYCAGLQRARELEVRLTQLDKEGAELRDENAALHARLQAADEAAAANTAAQLEEARTALARAERELGGLYKDKSSLLEEVMGANTELAKARSAAESATADLVKARAEVAALRDQLAELGSALEGERAARRAAAAELAAALGTRDAALTDSERLRGENVVLTRRLVELKEGEAGRMNEMNRMHEELLETAVRMRQEAELDRQANDLIRQRAVAAALSQSAMAPAAVAPPPPAGGGAAAAELPGGAASVMVTPGELLAHQPPLTSAPDGAAAAAAAGAATTPPQQQQQLPAAGAAAPWFGALAAKAKVAAAAAREAAGGLLQGNSAAAGAAAAVAAAAPAGPPAAASPPSSAASLGSPLSLKEAMALSGGLGPYGLLSGGGGGGGRPHEHRMPARVPARVVPLAHKGGVHSLAPQVPGHFVASCGADKLVALWDVSLVVGPGALAGAGAGPAIALSGITSAVNDCAFTCDAAQVVAAGADKSLHVWEATSGRHRHTLTGHAGAVTGVALSPLDCRLAVSISEDRSFKLWDLSRGFSVRSVPMTKMPLSLAVSRDANTLVTGHLDGSVLLWDLRQCRSGAAAPLLEARDQSQPVVAVAAAAADDSCLLLASRDGCIRLWDFRGAALLRLFRHPAFSLGVTGGTGKPRCRLGVSPDGRLLAAGAADGSVWVWDLEAANAEPKQLRGSSGSGPAHKDSVVAAAFSSDLSALVTADKAGGLAIWPME
ncbi:hypothetical protein HYH03_005876 [Edaphochlamys debaryana]|uniref:Autophagy-related protein 16 domain-containing protein n=1 Tax=Edaphochlamys debaryana TaxID=47281 RepID=A0A835Y4Q1_9CHLO|nr:hypothetical protein HYH03_005876 [Edaphochlamys debaryana]|eukprot:KAG2495946.1 hypothetical protein HYH03_005876 [Edaphochlamys debaryana]